MVDNAKREEALKKLMDIARNRTVRLYGHVEDFYRGGRDWPVDWQNELGNGYFKDKKRREDALNSTLERLVSANFPDTVDQINKEKGLVRLILDAGANPNFYSYFYKKPLFDQFLSERKSYAALEIAKTDGFTYPQNPDRTFEKLAESLAFYLEWKTPYPGETKEESAIHAQNCADRKDLVHLLFQKGFYPHNSAIFEKLVPVVLEKEPDFFDKKKQQVISHLQQAKTPLQIYNALMGQGKEKS